MKNLFGFGVITWLLFFLLIFFQQKAEGQNGGNLITIKVENKTLEEVIKQLENFTSKKFSYAENVVALNNKISVTIINKDLVYVLDTIAKLAKIEYKFIDDQIVIRDRITKQQQTKKTITGSVTDNITGEALTGATITIPGTTTGTITNFEGKFSLEIPSDANSLKISFIGYIDQIITLGNQNEIVVKLKASTTALNEVVVTALGITQEKKSLGYATQEIKSEEISNVADANIANKLSGRVAGMQVNTSSTIGGSTRIVLRGESTLSRSGSSPLIIVDGVSINNNEIITDDVDWGSGLSDINFNDIKSINVLKGPAASALYGSRAGNGAIVITTKSGSIAKKAQINFNHSTTFESILRYPTDYQYKYGPGIADSYQLLYNKDSTFNLDVFDEAWSTVPYDKNKLVELWYSPTTKGYRAGDTWNSDKGDIIKVPYVSQGTNNYKEFFKTGYSITNNVSVDLPGDIIHGRFSYSNLNQQGIMPGTDFKRHNIAINTTGKITDKLTINVSTNLISAKSNNRPSNRSGKDNIAYTLAWTPPGMNMDALKDYWQKGQEGTKQFIWRNGHNNLFFIAHEIRNTQQKYRVFGNASLNYEFNENINFLVRYGTDISSEDREKIRPYGTVGDNPSYEHERILLADNNADFLLSYTKSINSTINLSVSTGGNIFKSTSRSNWEEAPNLLLPGYETVNNTSESPQATQYLYEKQINSIYGYVNMDYKKAVYLSLTARNDWSSTLSPKNNSYFYPSIGLSSLLSELIQLPSLISFLKVRCAYAQVGKDTDPYRLENSLYKTTSYNGIVTYSVANNIANPDLKPEMTTSYEAGAETYFFKNRLGFDFTFYYNTTKNQVINIELARSTGYGSKSINAGKIENKGIEITMKTIPVNKNNFQWNFNVNFSQNRNKLIELAEGIEKYDLGNFGGYESQKIIAEIGKPLYGIYGYRQERVEDPESPYYGRLIFDENGLPVKKKEMDYLGNADPVFLLGLNNTFKYKNLAFNFLFDYRYGGKVFGSISRMMFFGGYSTETVELREQGFLGDGVVEKDDGTYAENTKIIPGNAVRLGYTDIHGRLTENFLYSGTFLKLREISLSYSLPSDLSKKLNMSNISFSIVGRNLFVLTKMPNQDPDTYVDGIPGNAGAYYFPTSRSYGFNINLTF